MFLRSFLVLSLYIRIHANKSVLKNVHEWARRSQKGGYDHYPSWCHKPSDRIWNCSVRYQLLDWILRLGWASTGRFCTMQTMSVVPSTQSTTGRVLDWWGTPHISGRRSCSLSYSQGSIDTCIASRPIFKWNDRRSSAKGTYSQQSSCTRKWE